MYDVFVRTWWKWQTNRYNQKIRVPHAGRKTFLARNVSIETARRLCDQYNSTHEPGQLSRKAEFESR